MRAQLHHHDPYRGARLRQLPRIGTEPVDRPVTLLAYVDRYPPFVNAGAEWMLHAMLRDSARRGHRVMVATGCVSSEHDVEGVEVYPAGLAEGLAVESDVLVGHLLWTNEIIKLAATARLPLLYLVHNDSQIRYWRLSSAKVSAFVWNSEWIAAKVSPTGEARDVPAVVVRPPLVRADYAVPDPPPETRPFVTLVNPIDAKGADVFYRLAATDQGRRYLAVEGAYGSQRRPDRRKHPTVEWQRQTGDMRGDVYARTRVLLMPSHYESWGRCAVEALAAGIPVIAHPTPGLVEAIGPRWPFYANHTAPAEWSAALRALDDPGTYAAASAAALARAAELEAIGRTDLDRWDRLLRMGAGGTVAGMSGHDPYRGGSASAAPAAVVGSAKQPTTDGVPSVAAEVVAWIRDADGDDRATRANQAWAVETQRTGGPRKTVADAVTSALG